MLGTRATASDLNAVAIVEEFHAQVVMEVVDVKGDDAQALPLPVGKQVQIGNGVEAGPHAVEDLFFTGQHLIDTHLFFQLTAQGYPHGLQEAGSTSVFTGFDLINVLVSTPGVGPVDGASTGIIRNAVGVQFRIEDQYAGATRAS